ncbi:VCBS domain-containing protein, partial [Comamonas jiangduensis]|uniref:VCBS domain-containing protein n=1 Tax=Comamonas jiangduensis TaxID=1194168 RepID=UPI0024E0C16F
MSWGTVTAMLGTTTVNLANYGTLTQSPSGGNWSFVLDNSKAATQALKGGESISVTLGYTLTDKDSDTANATVSFTIHGADDTGEVTIDAGAGSDAGKVYESGLNNIADTETTG